MRHFAALLLMLLALAASPRALAEPADIAAASRGVVRVVLVSKDAGSVQYVGHGSGFAVAPDLTRVTLDSDPWKPSTSSYSRPQCSVSAWWH